MILHINPEIASPLPVSALRSISLKLMIEITMPIMAVIIPINGIKSDKIPSVNDTTDLLFNIF